MSYNEYLSNDLNDFPEKIDEDLLQKRVQLLRAGDMSVVQPIAISLIRITMSIVRDAKSNDDELIGIAFITLIESIIKAATNLNDDNIVPYVANCIKMKINDAKNKNQLVPSRIIRKLIKDKKAIPKKIEFTEDENSCEHNVFNTYSHWKPIDTVKDRTNLVSNAYIKEILECKDIVDAVARSKRQRKIIELKMEGMTLKEISDNLGISQTRCCRELQDIQVRLFDYFND